MKKLKIRIGLAASRIAKIGNYMLRRAKHSTVEAVTPKEEEEEEHQPTIYAQISQAFSFFQNTELKTNTFTHFSSVSYRILV